MPLVDDFGGRVALLRERLRLTQDDIARQALPEDATEKEIKEYALSLSKIENSADGHRNPTLDRIRGLAKGFGFSVVDFMVRLEHVKDPPQGLIPVSQRSRDLFNHQSTKDLSEDVAKPDNAVDVADLQAVVDRLLKAKFAESAFEIIVEAITKHGADLSGELQQLRGVVSALLDRVVASDEQAPKAGGHKTGGSPRRG